MVPPANNGDNGVKRDRGKNVHKEALFHVHLGYDLGLHHFFTGQRVGDGGPEVEQDVQAESEIDDVVENLVYSTLGVIGLKRDVDWQGKAIPESENDY